MKLQFNTDHDGYKKDEVVSFSVYLTDVAERLQKTGIATLVKDSPLQTALDESPNKRKATQR